MIPTPNLLTPRLLLRPIVMEDAPAYQRYFADWDVIRHLSTAVPWPYPEGGCEAYMRDVMFPAIERGEQINWAITLKQRPADMIGSVVLRLGDAPRGGNRGFWLGVPWQGSGYMTEAVTAVQDFAFFELGLERLRVTNAVVNARSRRVKQKTGATFVGNVEIEHHEGGSDAEEWEVTKDAWAAARGVGAHGGPVGPSGRRDTNPPHVIVIPPAQSGAAAWVGRDMAARTGEWMLHLSDADVAELEAALATFLGRTTSGDDVAQRIGRMTAADFPLPTLGPRLAELRAELLHGRGFALLRRVPVERYSLVESAALFMGIGTHLGHARSQNAKGHVLGHVKDLGLSSKDPNVRIYQTRERQTFHTDSCDVVGLLCLREALAGGDSLLVSALTLYNEMLRTRPDLLARLLKPMAHDRRGEVPEGQKPYFMIPVFSWHAGQLTVFYQRQYFDSAQRFEDAPRLTPEDVEALDLFDALANDPRLNLTMRLAPGDMQFVHNHVMLHDRTGFEDHEEPAQRRHLLRLWLAVPDARELPESFKARYGSITIGDRGGIVVPGTMFNVPLDV
jgi:RimJ/RimL family protein N-acetyltransferase